MSNLGSHNPGNILVRDSAISIPEIQTALYATMANSEYIGNAVGDVNGYGTSKDRSFKTSLSGAIGNMQDVGIDLPFGVEFSDYTDSFTTDDKNDFVLSLIPTGGITIAGNANTQYVESANGNLNNSNEYIIDGRKIIFHTKPTNSFSVIYKGRYPSIDGLSVSGYMPNIYPSPELMKAGVQERPVITPKGNGIYEMLIKPSNRNAYGDIFSSRLEYSLSDKLADFVSPTGGTLCPSEHIGVWKLFNGSFQRIEDARISILAPNKIRFQTGIQINDKSDVLIIALNNWTVADTINAVVRYMLIHKHSSSDIGSQIHHKDILGLRSNRYNPDAREYGTSRIKGDDHPQYFNREGFINDNSGNFNNAIIGDVLIGSTNEFNLYNNTLGPSRKLYFGSTNGAASFMYDSSKRAIKLHGSENGLAIETYSNPNDTDNKHGKAIEFDGHSIFGHGGVSKMVAGVLEYLPNVLVVSPEDNIVSFKNGQTGSAVYAGKFDADIVEGHKSIELNDDKSKLVIGAGSFTNDDGNILVTSSDPAKYISFNIDTLFDTVFIKALTPELIRIKDNAKIEFGTGEDTHIRAIGETIDVVTGKPLTFSVTGKNTGMGFKTGNYNPFFNLYTSAEGGGSSTPTDHDSYMEAGSGDMFIIKGSTIPQTKDGVTYSFGDAANGSGNKRIDNLKQWPKADLHAGEGSFYSVNVNASSLDERRGVNFDDVASVYATGTDTECPPGWLVLESKNGVVLVDAAAGATDCQNIVYSELTSGPVKVFGDVTVDESIGVVGNIDSGGKISSDSMAVTNEAEFGSITVSDDSRFTGSVSFTENVTVNSELNVGGSISTSNRITANEINITSRSYLSGPVDIQDVLNVSGNITGNGSLVVGGDIRTNGKITSSSALLETATIYKLRTTDAIDATGGIVANGKITATGNIESESDIIADGGKFTTQVKTNNLVVDKDQTVGGELYVTGKFQVAGDVTIGANGTRMAVNSDTIFNNNKSSFLGVVEVSQDTYLKGELSVTSDARFTSSIEVGGQTVLKGPVLSSSSSEFQSIRIIGQSQLQGDVYIGERLSISKSISIGGGISVKGDSTIGDENSIIVVGGRTQFNRDVGFTGKVNISGETNISGNASITGQLTINSKANIEGELSAAGNASIRGILTANGLKTTAQSEFSGGLISDKTIVTESINTTGSAVFQNGVNVTGASQFLGGISTAPTDISNFGTVNVSGHLNQSDNTVTNQFAANTIFNNDVSVGSNMSVKGSIYTGSNESGCFIQNNVIELKGNTSTVISKNAAFDSISGALKINVSVTGSSSVISSKVSAFTAKDYTKINNLYVEDSQVNRGDILCLGTLYVGSIQTIETTGSQNIFDEKSATLNMRVARAKYAP